MIHMAGSQLAEIADHGEGGITAATGCLLRVQSPAGAEEARLEGPQEKGRRGQAQQEGSRRPPVRRATGGPARETRECRQQEGQQPLPEAARPPPDAEEVRRNRGTEEERGGWE